MWIVELVSKENKNSINLLRSDSKANTKISITLKYHIVFGKISYLPSSKVTLNFKLSKTITTFRQGVLPSEMEMIRLAPWRNELSLLLFIEKLIELLHKCYDIKIIWLDKILYQTWCHKNPRKHWKALIWVGKI